MTALPIDSLIPRLQTVLASHASTVLQAPPGAGKTTRVPLALLDEPWLAGRKIVMLEPRRLAAMAAARFMAAQLGEAVGQTVGYRVRLESRVGPLTRVEVVTEGVLTRMLDSDPALERVGLVIFDEFHERSLQADLGLALCLDSQSVLRDDLKIIVMSATLDAAPVAALLGGAPLLTSEGRSFPVEKRYIPAVSRNTSSDICAAAERVVKQALAEDHGSVLVFLPGAGEIQRLAKRLSDALPMGEVLIAPLYAGLPAEDQRLAIARPPDGQRKVVLATNIAETSLTLDGIRIVVDSGLARVARFHPGVALTRLDTVAISQASAEQRAGRAGRQQSGVCYRMWPKGRALIPHSPAEILEADLASLALELARWGVRDPGDLKWLDPPPSGAYAQACELLRQLGALDSDGRITAHGRAMAALAMEPRLAHMVMEAKALGLGALACDLAGLLAQRDVLRGELGRDADIRLRLQALQGRFISGDVDSNALRQVRKAAARWRKQLDVLRDNPDADAEMAGVLLGLAYPDRIAQRRTNSDGRYLLASGRGAALREADGLRVHPYLVVAQMDAGQREGRVNLAAPLDEGALFNYFSHRIERRQDIRWGRREAALIARDQRLFGALVLDDKPLETPDRNAVTAAMVDGVQQLGLGCLPWNEACRHWQQRVALMRALEGDHWPQVDDAALQKTAHQWLAPFLAGVTRREQLQKLDLFVALAAMLSWEQQRRLDECVPTHWTVPTGVKHLLDYSQSPPVLSVQLQEMFGLAETPRIAGGRVKLVLHLLSPAKRPVQVTQDLAGFWANSYHDVKKELKGRYPKHHWPDDPLGAEPTRRAKRGR